MDQPHAHASRLRKAVRDLVNRPTIPTAILAKSAHRIPCRGSHTSDRDRAGAQPPAVLHADRKPDPVRGHGNLADQIENFGCHRLAAGDAVIHRDLEHVEMRKIVTRPVADGAAIANADGGRGFAKSHLGAWHVRAAALVRQFKTREIAERLAD